MKFLKWVNSLPVRFTIKHNYEADIALDSPEAWDTVRESHPHFVIPAKRQDWLDSLLLRKDGQDENIPQRAEAIIEIIRSLGVQRVHSVGCGGGSLEYYLKAKMPELYLIASDYNPEGMKRLREVFIEADEVRVFDIKEGGYDAELVLMYRVDPHFTDAEWRDIFSRIDAKYVLYIPAHTLTPQKLYLRKRREIGAWLDGKKTAFAGYIRTKKMFETYWPQFKATEVDVFKMPGWLLERDEVRGI